MSTEREFEDFLRNMTPGRALRDRVQVPYTVARAAAYQLQTYAIEAALLSGSRVRLEAAVFSEEVVRAA